MPDNAAYLAFLNDPDQGSRRAELRDFFGPNADKFLRVYDSLQQSTAANAGKPKINLFSGAGGFSAAAMFTGPVWFFYRKMWAVAWTIVAVMVALLIFFAFVPTHNANLPFGIFLGLFAYRTYVPYAINKLQRLRRPDGSLDRQAVLAAGGVSVTAGWIAGIVFGLFVMFELVGLVLLARDGSLGR